MKFTISESQGRRFIGYMEGYRAEIADDEELAAVENDIASLEKRLAHLARRREEKDQGIERNRGGRVQRRA